jgi:acyl carrier protein
MKEEIRALLEDILPLVNFDSDFLFAELDSIGITAILMTLSQKYNIVLEVEDATPKSWRKRSLGHMAMTFNGKKLRTEAATKEK